MPKSSKAETELLSSPFALGETRLRFLYRFCGEKQGRKGETAQIGEKKEFVAKSFLKFRFFVGIIKI